MGYLTQSKKKIVHVAYLGCSHGAFLRYFIDRFSKLTPPINEPPFLSNGTSHNLDVKYSGMVTRYTFIDTKGNIINNYKIPEKFKNVPAICIIVDEKSLLNFTRLNFFRENDHEFQALGIYEQEKYFKVSDEFSQVFNDKIQNMYNINMSENNLLPKSIVRDFFKFMFIDLNNNSFYQATKKIKENLDGKKILPFLLSDIWNTENFFKRLKEVDKIFNLQLDLGDQAHSLHTEFLNHLPIYKTLSRVDNIINAIKTERDVDCSDLDFAEQGFICAWIEKNYKFIITPNTRNFFKNTEEILEYVKFYPNHYKAMNPNLPTFNGITNPFYLWKKQN